jgi:hypothetical protein
MAAAKDGSGTEIAAGNGRRLHLGIPEAVFVVRVTMSSTIVARGGELVCSPPLGLDCWERELSYRSRDGVLGPPLPQSIFTTSFPAQPRTPGAMAVPRDALKAHSGRRF